MENTPHTYARPALRLRHAYFPSSRRFRFQHDGLRGVILNITCSPLDDVGGFQIADLLASKIVIRESHGCYGPICTTVERGEVSRLTAPLSQCVPDLPSAEKPREDEAMDSKSKEGYRSYSRHAKMFHPRNQRHLVAASRLVSLP